MLIPLESIALCSPIIQLNQTFRARHFDRAVSQKVSLLQSILPFREYAPLTSFGEIISQLEISLGDM